VRPRIASGASSGSQKNKELSVPHKSLIAHHHFFNYNPQDEDGKPSGETEKNIRSLRTRIKNIDALRWKERSVKQAIEDSFTASLGNYVKMEDEYGRLVGNRFKTYIEMVNSSPLLRIDSFGKRMTTRGANVNDEQKVEWISEPYWAYDVKVAEEEQRCFEIKLGQLILKKFLVTKTSDRYWFELLNVTEDGSDQDDRKATIIYRTELPSFDENGIDGKWNYSKAKNEKRLGILKLCAKKIQ
jgi:hypothetical protein